MKTPTIVFARGTTLDAAHGDIQIMPPGTHLIAPLGADGEPVEMTVSITAKTAETLEASRAANQAHADAGSGDAPFIDFNHEDREASAWVKAIYWAGDDPVSGGVRAKLEWTAAGREAVEGKSFRRFSPAFCVDQDSGEITGAPINMGGLVNRAAFRNIAALFAKSTNIQEPLNQKTKTMTPEEITALQAENEQLRARISELETTIAEAEKAAAVIEVDAAAKAGLIAPDPAVKAKWVEMLTTSPQSREILASLKPNPAFTPVVTAKGSEHKPTTADLRAKLAELPRGERPAFFAAHRDAILAKA